MSFGLGIGDILAVSKLALDVYRACKSSSKEFQSIAAEVSSLRVILEDLNDDLKKDGVTLSPRREQRLCLLLENASNALHELQQELMKFESLTTDRRKKYDVMRWGFKEVSEIRMRIVSIITSLNALETILSRLESAQLRKLIIKYFKEVKEKQREGCEHSILSSTTIETVGKNETWDNLHKELEDVGIDPSVLDEKRGFITEVLQQAIEDGTIDEADVGSAVPTLAPSIAASSGAPPLRHWATESTLIDEAYAQRRMKTAPSNESNAEVSQLMTLYTSGGRNLSKKHSKFTSYMLRKLGVVSDERLIEAADEGDLKVTLQLISRGANPATSDKWLWTPLHMAAYGGFEMIAQVLILHGADIGARTVDGETPLLLAERNGHKAVVDLISEEVERRERQKEIRDERLAAEMGEMMIGQTGKAKEVVVEDDM